MGKPRILVADDDRLMRWSATLALQRKGYAVAPAHSRAWLLQAAARGDVDVVIADCGFCQSSGLELLGAIKSASPRTHVIVMTGDAISGLDRRARNRGAFEVLEKPFPISALTHAVSRALATPERRKGPRGCCGGCLWTRPCAAWSATA
jgi:two-component system C4-dicarboxylate transport response regulator DctD